MFWWCVKHIDGFLKFGRWLKKSLDHIVYEGDGLRRMVKHHFVCLCVPQLGQRPPDVSDGGLENPRSVTNTISLRLPFHNCGVLENKRIDPYKPIVSVIFSTF